MPNLDRILLAAFARSYSVRYALSHADTVVVDRESVCDPSSIFFVETYSS